MQARKELHNKSQRKNNEEEMARTLARQIEICLTLNNMHLVFQDAPQKDELVPEKLERPENALEEARKFLSPLQLLSSKDLYTHMLAFEIYYRKSKPLLMLQAIKRALSLKSSEDPNIHGCIIRFQKFVDDNKSK